MEIFHFLLFADIYFQKREDRWAASEENEEEVEAKSDKKKVKLSSAAQMTMTALHLLLLLLLQSIRVSGLPDVIKLGETSDLQTQSERLVSLDCAGCKIV